LAYFIVAHVPLVDENGNFFNNEQSGELNLTFIYRDGQRITV